MLGACARTPSGKSDFCAEAEEIRARNHFEWLEYLFIYTPRLIASRKMHCYARTRLLPSLPFQRLTKLSKQLQYKELPELNTLDRK